ncbi:MAG: hypothetical protein FJ095_19215 [Deltaproteobacteria bacterium]|nr:hypothetical protein [Deltaproteobacteria bacterium]
MISRIALVSTALLSSLVACGGESSLSGSSSTGAGGAGAGGASASSSTGMSTGSTNPLGEPFAVSFGPVELAPGEEDTKCVVKRVPNAEAMHVGAIHNVLSDSSHHLIVYRVAETEERPEPFACQPFADLLKPETGTPLMITQKHDDLLALPKGVGFEFEAGQMVRLEMHYINTTSSPKSAQATATFHAMPKEDVTAAADLLFVGNPDITIAPMSKASLGPTFVPAPLAMSDAKYFGITGHTHRFGTKVTVSTAAAKGKSLMSVYDVEDWLWGEPETVYHDPPFAVPEYGGFEFSCAWNNTSNDTLGFGESATDEMCFFWTYYYPSSGAFVCLHTDQVNGDKGGVDLCCPGHPACGKIFE